MDEKQNRQIRGGRYGLWEFRTAYGLNQIEAERLFSTFGPGRVDLDLLMKTMKLKAERLPLVALDVRAS